MADPDPKQTETRTQSGSLLSRMDQAAIAVILAVSLVVIVSSAWTRGFHRGGVIDIDQSEPWEIKFQVDINTADWPELSLLPNVGEVLARRIVESRQQHGPFAHHDDLLRVSGIGPKTLAGIRPYLLPMTDAGDTTEK
ncbi:MAG: ComEA family DNA-binding protein [Pirellulaceae bacterium]|nr:ComEA family DNA-binding protein [Pirellulaceae bacterium]